MKVIVKTLKGEKFPLELDAASTVESIKQLIESTKSDMPALCMKLIHSGKVLKDTDSLDSVGIKENDFLVVMVTKPKKIPASAAPAPTDAPPSASTAPPAPLEPVAALSSTTVPPVATEQLTSTATPPASADTDTATEETQMDTDLITSPPPPEPEPPTGGAAETATQEEFATPEMVANLTVLGFPEAEVRHCLQAAQGNPDIAVEYLTNGIPAFSTSVTDPSSSSPPLQALRNHPQFNDLRRLVQSNPAMLQQVLTQIGHQQPELLREINANQAAFLEMMNEPVPPAADPSSQSGDRSSSSATITATAGGGSTNATGGSATLLGGGASNLAGADPIQMAQMMQNMDPGQLQMMATMMGLSPEQVQAVGRMIGQLPPEQLQEYMAQAMGNAAPSGGVRGPPGQHVLRLTEEEMAAVDRLTEMGFDRSEAAQAYLACDKNEAMAANLLMDGGFGFGGMDEDDDDNGIGGGDEDDDMYS